MDTKAFKVDIDASATARYQSSTSSSPSSLNEALIFLNAYVEEYLQDETSGTVLSNLGSKPDPSFGGDSAISLYFQNTTPPNDVFQCLNSRLQDRVLSGLISDRILAESQGKDMPPLFIMVFVELTRKVYLPVPSSIQERVVVEKELPQDLEI